MALTILKNSPGIVLGTFSPIVEHLSLIVAVLEEALDGTSFAYFPLSTSMKEMNHE